MKELYEVYAILKETPSFDFLLFITPRLLKRFSIWRNFCPFMNRGCTARSRNMYMHEWIYHYVGALFWCNWKERFKSIINQWNMFRYNNFHLFHASVLEGELTGILFVLWDILCNFSKWDQCKSHTLVILLMSLIHIHMSNVFHLLT